MPGDAWPELRGIPMQDCRTCADPIRFVRVPNGHGGHSAMPVNPLPDPAGNVCARRLSGGLTGYVISRDHPPDPLMLRFMPHYATCSEKVRATRAARNPTLF